MDPDPVEVSVRRDHNQRGTTVLSPQQPPPKPGAPEQLGDMAIGKVGLCHP